MTSVTGTDAHKAGAAPKIAAPPQENGEDFLVWTELASWSTGLAPWQRWLLARAADHRTVDPNEVDTAYRMLLHDTGLEASDAAPLPLVPERIAIRSGTDSPSRPILVEISDLTNVNAIPAGSRLAFGEGLTLIYGHNAAGKSGFARALAQFCFSRSDGEILHNVLAAPAASPGPPAASFKLRIDGVETELRAEGQDAHDLLRAFTVFDVHAARVHIGDDNPLSFSPTGMDVFREMVRVYGELATRLKNEIDSRMLGYSFGSRLQKGAEKTGIAIALAETKDSLDVEKLKRLAVLTPEDRAELTRIGAQLQELQANDPTTILAKKREQRAQLQALHARISKLQGVLGLDARRGYQEKLIRLAEAMTVATAEGASTFRVQGLDAVGTPEWTEFAGAARKLATKEGPAYPDIGQPCLLCQRPLDEPSTSLIRRLWGFLESRVQTTLQAINADLDGISANLMRAQTDVVPVDSVVRASLSESFPDVVREVETFVASLERVRIDTLTSLKGGVGARAVPLDAVPSPLPGIANAIQALSDEEASLAAGAVKEMARMRERACELQARSDVVGMIPEVEAYASSEKWCRRARDVISRDLSTKPLSLKERDFYKKVTEGRYLRIMKRECELLQCTMPVHIATKAQKGETVRSLSIASYRPHRILSEGEQRALALADFLTEVTLNPASAGIVLDDPVTSMDHLRKDAIAKRLVNEAGARQVIVFTHDLVFVDMLRRSAETGGVTVTIHWVQRGPDESPGFVSSNDCPALSKDYETTALAEQALTKAKATLGSEQLLLVRDGLGKLRRTVEETVLKHMFKGAVNRWDERIKIASIKEVSWSEQLADDLYKAFEDLSRFVEAHSHSDAKEPPPTPVDLQREISRVQGLIARAKAKRSSKPGN